MTSAILSTLHKPATAVMTAVAMYPHPDDFCKEVALRGLHDSDVIAVSILTHTQNADLQIVGSYGPKTVLAMASKLVNHVEEATREKNEKSIQVVNVVDSDTPLGSVVLIPSTPMTFSSGVIAIYYSTKKNPDVFEINTQIALAFACEMYCSPNWGRALSGNSRPNRAGMGRLADNTLTNRQRAVLELIAEGRTNERIARLLNYSVATIKNDIGAIFQFLGVSNRYAAIEEAESRSLLPPPKQSDEVIVRNIRSTVEDMSA